MPSGVTNTGSLSDSMPTVINSARIVREYDGIMMGRVEATTLREGTGLTFNEISLAQLSAQGINESTILNNPQQLADTLFSVRPTMIGIQTVITDRVKARISGNVAAKIGALGQNAMQRKKDEDLITVLDGATTSLGGAGTTLTSGLISAAVSRIKGNTVEPAITEISAVLHPFQVKDLQDELTASVGTYELTSGDTKDIFRQGYKGPVSGAMVFEDGNISIDSSDDAKGGVFAREAIVFVQGFAPRAEPDRWPYYGGGADVVYMYDEYGIGERSAGNWMYEVYTDALAPTT